MRVPNTDCWPRHEFLESRKKQLEAAHKSHPLEKRGCERIILDTGADIFCDFCDETITTQYVNLVDYGHRVACNECYQRHYRNEPLKYRRLNPDGSLGEEEIDGRT